ncbi:protein of unknown function [Beijerinckiaceae bacterium RH AL1]|jgi:hypothetical protein|nr:hypothetical protein [Beijerinckiaceae bacterium]VVB43939.1 protein of unknown function [Beijerinckiaceae bacterium RH CH11]VVB43966.1 protein of unknown function [Beijerinckiaceae bacterium RH AL8]VVC54090.1 protein of unknown function [Beijerinckiaceae bacterium RH AL1]
MTTIEDTKTLLRRAIAGESLTIDATIHSLHEMTQLAVALEEDANLAIRNAELMSPIERASVSTVGRGRVVFL